MSTSGTQIYIGHLSRNVSKHELYDFLRKIGPIEMRDVIIKRNYAFAVSLLPTHPTVSTDNSGKEC